MRGGRVVEAVPDGMAPAGMGPRAVRGR
jgi:hypothetical protein